MTLSQLTVKSDWIGMVVSGLCLVHCLATPFIFLAYVNVGAHGEAHPFWWGLLDIVFLIFSFFAVYWSARNTSKTWIKYAFGLLWLVLSLVILNEKLGVLSLPEAAIYFPTIGLIGLHIYNRHYCNCEDEVCCTDN
ncbi:MAG: MerC domain-containing protein [Bacteroidota bacterium]